MQPQVLYYCPCDKTLPQNKGATSDQPAASSSSTRNTLSQPPSLPAYSPAARYAFHQLEALYFCDECDKIRCNRCVTIEIAAYFCPNCLFEVPGASVKAEKNRCARNCFVCPCCTHILSVMASDGDGDAAGMLSPDSSQGQPPYYLGCSFCKWDSKSIGLVFDKPTGLSLQLQRQEDNAYDVLEFERLKDHFDPFLKAQKQAAAVAAAVGTSKLSAKSSSGESKSASKGPNVKSSRFNAANDAASSALKKSKLLRDLPLLSSSKHLSSQAGLNDAARAGYIEREELKPYEAWTSWNSGSTSFAGADKNALGIMGKREKHRRDYLSKIKVSEGDPNASHGDKLTSLAQRWQSLPDQPLRANDLRPTRIPLQAKQSKRCPACRHIIIKPDLKAASNRFKIKLVAINYLPEFQLSVASEQPFLTMSYAPSKRDVTEGLSSMSIRRRTDTSTGTSGQPASASTFLSTSLTSADVDTNKLIPGQTYSFQLNVTNPLDDALRVKVAFVRLLPFPSSIGDGVPVLQDSRYIFSSAAGSHYTATADDAAEHQHTTTGSRFGWKVFPSCTSFPLGAFNEVWELDESGTLLDDKSKTSSADYKDLEDAKTVTDDVESDFSDDDDPSEAQADETSAQRQRKKASGAAERKPFVQRGHTTTMTLDLTISKGHAPPPGHPIEVGMHVTYSYSVDPTATPDAGASSHTQRDFQFWTALRLGTVAQSSS